MLGCTSRAAANASRRKRDTKFSSSARCSASNLTATSRSKRAAVVECAAQPRIHIRRQAVGAVLGLLEGGGGAGAVLAAHGRGNRVDAVLEPVGVRLRKQAVAVAAGGQQPARQTQCRRQQDE